MTATLDQRPATSDQPVICPLISIIIPAYNSEKFIAKCLDSLINQDYPAKNYEILITDDGSTDQTGKICDDYASKYPFVHVTHTTNFGAAHARNIGLSQCKGSYITFCDSDDFVSPHLISVLTRIIELKSEADMIAFKYVYELPVEGWPEYDVKPSDLRMTDSEDFCMRVVVDDKNVGGYTWSKVTRREIAQSVMFDETASMAEDELWCTKVLLGRRDMKICTTDYEMYCYVQHRNLGLTREPSRIYGEDGFSGYVVSLLKELEIENIPTKIEEQMRCNLYAFTVANLYQAGRTMSAETRKTLNKYARENFGRFYLRSKLPAIMKIKLFIKHILIILHLNK